MTFVSTPIAAFTLDKPGYLVTVGGRASIALCGGWEMSTTCRRGVYRGLPHAPIFETRPGRSRPTGTAGDDGFWCRQCDMPLHEIGADLEHSELMSIERHVIEELPW